MDLVKQKLVGTRFGKRLKIDFTVDPDSSPSKKHKTCWRQQSRGEKRLLDVSSLAGRSAIQSTGSSPYLLQMKWYAFFSFDSVLYFSKIESKSFNFAGFFFV